MTGDSVTLPLMLPSVIVLFVFHVMRACVTRDLSVMVSVACSCCVVHVAVPRVFMNGAHWCLAPFEKTVALSAHLLTYQRLFSFEIELAL
jgi:hypothetical protein